ncbi:GA module-containing protein [Corynebacterium propinquum]|uniref:GA module-containing protein n=2 Tax=Corynebacterium propinquum TaxID=43769 RepID=UPI0012DF7238|nr:GA module-containing protein [Corynebacterium propinquum]QQU86947.1 GA module-containing protein [Corynebacterium propinquum]QQU90935.1 GA module-containing protein [Corynebacterium propinquum]WKS45280.1 GA module-containing protein [Corynebacterium propinquum]
MSNLKLVAGTMKRRGIAIAAAVAVAGGSLATTNNAMAVEVDNPGFDELVQEFQPTEAGKPAAKAAFDTANALKAGKSDEDVRAILKEGLQKAAEAGDAGFTQADIDSFDQDKLNEEFDEIINSGKTALQKKDGVQPDQSQDSVSPAPTVKYSPQRLEAEFGGTKEGKVAQETAEQLVEAFRRGATKQDANKIVRDSFAKAGLTGDFSAEEINKFVEESYQRFGDATGELQFKKALATKDLADLTKLNPLQREIFQKQIDSANTISEVITVEKAAKAENANPVQQFAPVPGQKAPEKSGEKTDVEKALEYTKQEALKKLEGFGFLTPQQKDAYTKAVKEATEVYQVEAAFETGEAKNKANEEAKNAKNFVGKALARTKQLALKQLDEMTGLNHEQKREARKKIVDADQVYKVEAAFHTAEKLNSAKK